MRPIIATLTAAFAFAGAIQAQQTESHIPIPDWGGGAGGPRDTAELAKQLKGRLGQRPAASAPQIDPKLLEQVREMMRQRPTSEWQEILQKHPELADLVKRSMNDSNLRDELLKGGTSFQERQQAERLQKLQDQFRQSQSSAAGTTANNRPITANAGSGNSTAPKDPNQANSKNTPIGNVRGPSGIDSLIPRPSARSSDATMSEFAKSMERWFGKSFGDSPAMKRFTSDMGKKDWDKILDSAMSRAGSGPRVNWNKVGNRLQRTGRFLDRHAPSLSGTHLPNAPNFNAPNLPRGPNLPNMTVPSAAGTAAPSGLFTALLVAAGMALGAFLFWRLVLRPMKLAKRGANAESNIGPWPVDPTRITTREELVKAFDYLALRTCGKPARMWHYREVANRLGSDDPQRRRTAANLAQTYAVARYAPPSEQLAESTAQQAAQDICALAGEAVP